MKLSKSVLGSVAALSLTVVSAFATVPAQTSMCNYTFNTNLRLGAVSTDVQNLQKLLNMDAATRVATVGAGSPGFETLRFGPATFAAVKKFQAANGVAPQSGYVGPLSRAVLNTVCNGTGNTTTNPTTGNGTGVSSNSVPVSVLVAGQATAKLGEFVVSGNGTVTGLELQRIGVSNNDTLVNVYLYDGATRITDSASVLTDGTIRFTNSQGLFMTSGSKTVTVRADIASGSNGQTIGVALKSITMMGATSSTAVTGVAGPLFSIASANPATVQLTTNNQGNTTQNVNAGTLAQNVFDVTLNVGTRAAYLKGLTFKYLGSADKDAVQNLGLFVDGTKVASGAVNANNTLVFDLAGTPVMLNTGSRNIQVRGDFVKGSNRTAQFYLQNAADYMIEDSQLTGVNVTVCASSCSTTSPVAATNVYGYNYSILTGQIVANIAPGYTDTKVVGGANNVSFGKFEIKGYGEDTKVDTLVVNIVNSLTGYTAGSGGNLLQNVGLYVNGGSISSTRNVLYSLGSTSAITFNPGSQLIIPAGGSVIVEVKGDLRDSAGATYTGGSIQTNLVNTAGGSIVRGQNSQNTVTFAGASGRLLSVSSNNFTFTKTGSFTANTVAPSTAGVKIGSFTAQNSDSEDVVVTNLTVTLAVGAGTTLSNYSNLRVSDSSVIFGQPTSSNNFSLNVTIPKNGQKTFDIYADLGSSQGVTATVNVDASVTSRGVTTGNTLTGAVTGTTVAVTSNVSTLAAGDVTVLSSSPVSQLVLGGTQSEIVRFNIKSSTAPANITEMTFTIAPSSAEITSITVGGVTRQVTGTTGNVVTGLNLMIPSGNAGLDIPVTVTYGNVNTNGGVTSQTSAASIVTLTAVKYTSGNVTTDLTGLVGKASNGQQLVASKPVVTVASNSNNSISSLNLTAETQIGQATVAADQKGNITLKTLTFNVSNSGFTTAPTSFTGSRLADGNTTISDAVCTPTGVTVITCAFTTGYTITAGSSKTFNLFTTPNGAANTGTNKAQISTRLSNSSTDFGFIDVNGSVSTLNGQNIYQFPTNSYTVTQ